MSSTPSPDVGSQTVTVILGELGDNELGVLRALEQAGEPVDDARIASAAKIAVSSARDAARKLVRLGLAQVSVDTEGEERFEILPDKVDEQIEAVAEAGVTAV